MKQKDVEVGQVYLVKVSGNLCPVRILDRAKYSSGWVGVNLDTGRSVYIRSAQRLRRPLKADGKNWI